MQNDRILRISMAGSRKAVYWPENRLLWSEFVECLRTPVRSPETLEEYLSYPKSRQDELKDVGGFVGGTFQNGRRKANQVEGRDLVTLDLDSIPAGQTAHRSASINERPSEYWSCRVLNRRVRTAWICFC